jgi:DHA2 family multidrug resistance protein
MMPRALAMAVVFPVAGRLYNKGGPKLFIGSGLLISAYSFWRLSRMSLDVGYWDLFWPQVFQGVGFALIFVALTTAAVAELRKEQISDATGLYNVIRRVFGSAGVALAATQIDRGRTAYHAKLMEGVNAFGTTTQQWLHRLEATLRSLGNAPAVARQKALAMIDGEVSRQAAMLAFNHVFYLIAIIFVCCLPLIWFLHGNGAAEMTE